MREFLQNPPHSTEWGSLQKGIWELHPYTKGEQVHLASVDFHCPISLFYEDVLLR